MVEFSNPTPKEKIRKSEVELNNFLTDNRRSRDFQPFLRLDTRADGILRKVRVTRRDAVSGQRKEHSGSSAHLFHASGGSLSVPTCRGYPRRRSRSRACSWRKKRDWRSDALSAGAVATAAAAAAGRACALVAWRPTYVVCGRTQGRHTTAWCIGDPGGDDRRCAPSGWREWGTGGAPRGEKHPAHGVRERERERERERVAVEGGTQIGRGDFRGNVRDDSRVRECVRACVRVYGSLIVRLPAGSCAALGQGDRGGSDLLAAPAVSGCERRKRPETRPFPGWCEFPSFPSKRV